MEIDVSDFDIFLDTDNELRFTVAIEGAAESSVRSQFVLEGAKGMNLCFEGRADGSDITVDVPSLKGILREGTYNTRLEVIVDDRVFTPLQLQAMVKAAVKVEAVVRSTQKTGGPVVTATVNTRQKTIVEAPIEKMPAPVPVVPARAPVKVSNTTTTRAPAPVRKSPAVGLDRLLDVLDDS